MNRVEISLLPACKITLSLKTRRNRKQDAARIAGIKHKSTFLISALEDVGGDVSLLEKKKKSYAMYVMVKKNIKSCCCENTFSLSS